MKGGNNLKEFNALVTEHYDFVSKKDGKHIVTTKCLVNLCEFGVIAINSELANDIDAFTLIKVKLAYKGKKPVIAEITGVSK